MGHSPWAISPRSPGFGRGSLPPALPEDDSREHWCYHTINATECTSRFRICFRAWPKSFHNWLKSIYMLDLCSGTQAIASATGRKGCIRNYHRQMLVPVEASVMVDRCFGMEVSFWFPWPLLTTGTCSISSLQFTKLASCTSIPLFFSQDKGFEPLILTNNKGMLLMSNYCCVWGHILKSRVECRDMWLLMSLWHLCFYPETKWNKFFVFVYIFLVCIGLYQILKTLCQQYKWQVEWLAHQNAACCSDWKYNWYEAPHEKHHIPIQCLDIIQM